ncbi:MAG: pyridoxal phosphate-dependent aminotransferase [Pseudomonadota bacterium]
MDLSSRIDRIQPSATIAFTRKALAMKEAGRQVISLSAGEPDFDTPDHILDAARLAIADGKTRYTAVDGTAELKQAISDRLARDGMSFGTDQILVTSGAKQALFNAMLALLNPGDEAIVPAPYWVSYPDMVRLGDGEAVIVPCPAENGFKLTAGALEGALTTKTRMLILNSPGNPTGRAYSRAEYQALGEVLQRYPRVWILTDEIYDAIYWGDEAITPFLGACPELTDRTLVVNGVSKAYAMTGWRIGYGAGPVELITAMRKIQGQSTSNACSISQAAAVAALNGDQSCVAEMTAAYRRRHDLMLAGLNDLPGVTCLPGEGAFYLLPDFSAAAARLAVSNDIELATQILEEAEVAMVPGTPFGAPGHIRVAYATSDELLNEALRRLGKFLS